MTIETYLKEVPGKGLGIFSTKHINASDIVYEDDDFMSKIFHNTWIKELPEIQQKFIKKYATYKKDTNIWYLCLDDARFWNHSDTPNTTYIIDSKGNGYMVAIHHIPPGTELTSNYREFCDECKDGYFDFEIVK